MLNNIRISKFLSYVLRHNPSEHGLDPDRHGFCSLKKVCKALRKRFRKAGLEDILHTVENDPKGRFEIKGNRIRATYGHSVNVVPPSEPVFPPGVLYHGTSEKNAERIIRHGLRPMGRKYVHLSSDTEDARKVGSRHSSRIQVLEVDTECVRARGFPFYCEGAVFLVERVPADCVTKASE